MTLVENARNAWRWFSVQSMVLAGAIQLAWLEIPDALRESLPVGAVQGITITLLMLGILGRVIKQIT
jgi:hypothetical protein